MQNNYIEIDQWNEYNLSQSFDGISIKGEENIIEEYELGNDNAIGFKSGSRSYNFTPQFNYGIKSIDSLEINISDGAKLKPSEKLKLSYLKITSKDHVNFELDIEVDQLELDIRDNSSITLTGKAKNTILDIENHAVLDGSGFTSEQVNINMHDNSKVDLKSADLIKGSLRDHALLQIEDQQSYDKKDISTNDNAEVKIK